MESNLIFNHEFYSFDKRTTTKHRITIEEIGISTYRNNQGKLYYF